MARVSLTGNLGIQRPDGGWSGKGGAVGFGGGAAATPPSTATVDTDVGVLVADGASPTQGHVNTLNTDWGVLKPLIAATAAATSGDVVLQFDTTKITTWSQLRDMTTHLLNVAKSSSILTP